MKPAVRACLTLLVLYGCREEPLAFGPAAFLDVTVLDHLHSPVVQSRVEARNRDDVLRAAEFTDNQGRVRISLVPGKYSITVDPPEGYSVPASRQIELIENQPVRWDVQLNNLQPAVAGLVFFNFETSVFEACGEPASWWLTGPASGEVYRQYAELRRQGAHNVWLAGRARLREGSSPNHREIEITHIEQLRVRRASDCPERRVSIDPQGAELAVGDTVRIDIAVFDAQDRQIAPDGVVWTSSHPAVATVDASGLMRVLARSAGPVQIIARRDNIADTADIYVMEPWRPEGYGKVEGIVLNTDGSAAPGIALMTNCAGSTIGVTSDQQGRFAVSPAMELGNHLFLSDERDAMCVARTDPRNNGDAAITLHALRYSRPGRGAPVSQITLIRKPRGASLVLSASSQSLRVGEAVVISTQTFVPEGLVFRSLLPEVATVDSIGRVTARAPGSVLIAAHSRADTTRIGWLEIRVNRF